MPTYDYQCEACNHTFERWQGMTAPKLRTCPECGKRRLVRLVGAGAGVIFRGSGFYETDYKRKESKPGSKGSSGADTSSSGTSGSGTSGSDTSGSGTSGSGRSGSGTSSSSGSSSSGRPKGDAKSGSGSRKA